MSDRATCEWCDAETTTGTVCPWSLACPSCHVKPGARCIRPSGHPASSMHAPRYLLAESHDAAAGVTYGPSGTDHDDREAEDRAWGCRGIVTAKAATLDGEIIDTGRTEGEINREWMGGNVRTKERSRQPGLDLGPLDVHTPEGVQRALL